MDFFHVSLNFEAGVYDEVIFLLDKGGSQVMISPQKGMF